MLAAGGLVVRGAAVAGVVAPVGVSCSTRRLLRGALLARRPSVRRVALPALASSRRRSCPAPPAAGCSVSVFAGSLPARGCAVSAFSPRSAAFVAFSCGSLTSVCVCPGRSGAAWVLVAGFGSFASASAFARPRRLALGARWRSAVISVAPPASGRCPARSFGARRVARPAPVACWPCRVGCAVCPKCCFTQVCRVSSHGRRRRCSRGLLLRLSSALPLVPALVAGWRARAPGAVRAGCALWFAPCPLCGVAGLVLDVSGAARPFLWCAWCGVASPAPARSRWIAVAGSRRPCSSRSSSPLGPHPAPTVNESAALDKLGKRLAIFYGIL